jgi:cobalt-zinc-cadmium efflux system membrane fusion protein
VIGPAHPRGAARAAGLAASLLALAAATAMPAPANEPEPVGDREARSAEAGSGGGAWSGGEPIAVTAGEMERLGIRLAAPSAATALPMSRVSARVTVPPARQFVVAAAADGLLSRLLAAPGDTVTAGEVVATIESPGLVTLQRDLLDARSRLRLARQQLERDESLLGDGIIPERRLEQTRSDFEEASHRADLARQRLILAGYAAADVERLASTGKLSPRLPLRSPVDGTVLEQYASPGERLHMADPILRIADLSQLWLVLQVPPQELRRLAPGQLVVPADRLDAPLARVDTLGAVLDPQTQTIPVRAVLLPGSERYGAGEFLSVQVIADAAADGTAWSLPGAAVVRLGDQDAVFVREGEGFTARPVGLLSEAADRQIVSGALTRDMRIAVSGTATLKAMWQEAR